MAGALTASTVLVPAANSTAEASDVTIMASQAHVNSNITYTWLYVSPHGDTHYDVKLGACTNFWYDVIDNGRYHDITHNGWVSTDKAGPGWC
ncbi:hypothetical protein ACIGNX_33635 [Actinosynnema sp. NPDC053489]|uniref:hypothetical protein n=1 Tax=Actinosynnema sp. NPDC053489 TaxID=3363916 RepID=UPI0037C99B26